METAHGKVLNTWVAVVRIGCFDLMATHLRELSLLTYSKPRTETWPPVLQPPALLTHH
jgi:hypothetical protein